MSRCIPGAVGEIGLPHAPSFFDRLHLVSKPPGPPAGHLSRYEARAALGKSPMAEKGRTGRGRLLVAGGGHHQPQIAKEKPILRGVRPPALLRGSELRGDRWARAVPQEAGHLTRSRQLRPRRHASLVSALTRQFPSEWHLRASVVLQGCCGHGSARGCVLLLIRHFESSSGIFRLL